MSREHLHYVRGWFRRWGSNRTTFCSAICWRRKRGGQKKKGSLNFTRARDVLRETVGKAGMDSAEFGLHSLRSDGTCTTASATAKVPWPRGYWSDKVAGAVRPSTPTPVHVRPGSSPWHWRIHCYYKSSSPGISSESEAASWWCRSQARTSRDANKSNNANGNVHYVWPGQSPQLENLFRVALDHPNRISDLLMLSDRFFDEFINLRPIHNTQNAATNDRRQPVSHARSSPMPDHPPSASTECFSTREL